MAPLANSEPVARHQKCSCGSHTDQVCYLCGNYVCYPNCAELAGPKNLNKVQCKIPCAPDPARPVLPYP